MWKHFLVASITALILTGVGVIKTDVFVDAADALSTMVLVFIVVFFVEKIVNFLWK